MPAGTSAAPGAERDVEVAGVVFLEDVLEELVGVVRDATQRSGAHLAAASAADRG